MNCDTCRDHLSEYLDGDLSADLYSKVRDHLASCETCSAEADATLKLDTVARRLPRHAPGMESTLRISEMIHHFGEQKRRTEFGPVMDVEELADFLRVDPVTIEVYLDELPCFELGGKLLFNRKSIEKWITHKELVFAAQGRTASLDSTVVPEDVAWGDESWTL